MSGKRQIAKNMIFNTISFGINFIISFFFTPYLIRTVGKEAYSFFPLVNNIIGYSSILTAAVGSMGGRFITMSFYQNDRESANQYFNSIWVANIFLSILFTLVSIVVIVFISDILTVPEYLKTDVQWLFAFGVISMILGLLTGLFGIGTYVKNRLDLLASRNVLINVIRVLCILLLFYIFKPTIVFMSLSAFVAAIVGLCFNISFKKKLLPELTVNPQKYFSWNKIKETTFSGMWNSLNQLSSVLLNQVDLLITNVFIGAAATGDYSIAKTAPILVLNLLSILSGTFMPHFNILYAKNQTTELIKDVSRSIELVSLLIGIPMGFLLVFSGEFFELWVPGQDSEMLYWLSFLTVAPLIVGATINPVYGLFGVVNKLKVPSIAVLIGSSMQTIVILILINTTELGIWSIPIVSGIQAVLRNVIFTTVYGGLCLGRKWNTFFPALIKGILAMLVVVGVCLALKPFVKIDNFLILLAVFALAGIISIAININIIFDRHERVIVFNMIKNKIKR
ncbi:lipopolysaccharide biosynthesis protein [Fibrobacter sp. UWB5]|uniref:lipopolysaccharide biosynthesis protein n=1 Tax=Fibrobacter sp. UWB5 TaxID=1964360 RepID=UPI000B5284D3|nr:oligosaccharide flippase family protein [Fibrobacter sp. UWB5]OWV14373.1 polysaccharide biosynthesis protein [Fibrobacter sp. UWB5]